DARRPRGENSRDQERDQRHEWRAISRVRFALDGKEAFLSKLARLPLGPLSASEALRGNAVSRRHAAVQRNVHRPPRTRGSALRRKPTQSCWSNDIRGF